MDAKNEKFVLSKYEFNRILDLRNQLAVADAELKELDGSLSKITREEVHEALLPIKIEIETEELPEYCEQGLLEVLEDIRMFYVES
jgi:hypothetical protein